MSMESATAFYERLESDTELTARIQELQTSEAVGQYVREELGYNFSLEEMQKVIFERHPEITDEEMEAVVGGLDPQLTMSIVGLTVSGATAGLAVVAAGVGLVTVTFAAAVAAA